MEIRSEIACPQRGQIIKFRQLTMEMAEKLEKEAYQHYGIPPVSCTKAMESMFGKAVVVSRVDTGGIFRIDSPGFCGYAWNPIWIDSGTELEGLTDEDEVSEISEDDLLY